MARDRDRRRPGPEPPKLPPPDHGIRVQRIGATWWGVRWVAALSRLGGRYQARLHRGQNYARGGRVHDLAVKGRVVTAAVTGTEQYRVSLELRPLDGRVWRQAIRAMAGKARFAAQLLGGEMPREIDRAFATARASLFPTRASDLRTQCSCPDQANPCKHIAALHYVLGDAFDRDPFLLFELRGRTKEAVLRELRERRSNADRTPPGGAAEPAPAEPARRRGATLEGLSPEAYEAFRAPVEDLHFRIAEPARQAAVLRSLGAPPGWGLDVSFEELAQPAVERAARAAREIANR